MLRIKAVDGFLLWCHLERDMVASQFSESEVRLLVYRGCSRREGISVQALLNGDAYERIAVDLHAFS